MAAMKRPTKSLGAAGLAPILRAVKLAAETSCEDIRGRINAIKRTHAAVSFEKKPIAARKKWRARNPRTKRPKLVQELADFDEKFQEYDDLLVADVNMTELVAALAVAEQREADFKVEEMPEPPPGAEESTFPDLVFDGDVSYRYDPYTMQYVALPLGCSSFLPPHSFAPAPAATYVSPHPGAAHAPPSPAEHAPLDASASSGSGTSGLASFAASAAPSIVRLAPSIAAAVAPALSAALAAPATAVVAVPPVVCAPPASMASPFAAAASSIASCLSEPFNSSWGFFGGS
jgi:hypothetical protein